MKGTGRFGNGRMESVLRGLGQDEFGFSSYPVYDVPVVQQSPDVPIPAGQQDFSGDYAQNKSGVWTGASVYGPTAEARTWEWTSSGPTADTVQVVDKLPDNPVAAGIDVTKLIKDASGAIFKYARLANGQYQAQVVQPAPMQTSTLLMLAIGAYLLLS